MQKLNVGVIGLGTVGGGVVRLLRVLRGKHKRLEGVDVVLAAAADVRPSAFRGMGLRAAQRSGNWRDVTGNDRIHVVCELIGGTTVAYDVIHAALNAGKHVVTANKALLAEHGPKLFELARRRKVMLRFEAAVAGGVPILRALREGLGANTITSVVGILNGTSNYILHAMAHDALSFERALKSAQRAGFAEADPTLDIGGHDAAHKLVILSALAFHSWTPLAKVYTEGIGTVGLQDVAYAAELGYVIKSLAIARVRGLKLEVRVHPTLIPRDDVLASVPREYNAVLVHGDATGPTLYFGKGAGRLPTASSVLADVLDIARDVAAGSGYRLDPMPMDRPLPVWPMEQVESRYYLRLTARDVPGVFGKMGRIFQRQGISIASVVQKEPVIDQVPRRARGSVPVVILFHPAREGRMQRALAQLRRLDCVLEPMQLLRIEGRGE